jgi:biopolymer transport protein ExbB
MLQILIKGGWMMIPIALCSLIAASVIFERFCFFARLRRAVDAESVLDLVHQGRIEDARTAIESMAEKKSNLPMMKVLAAGLNHPVEASGAMESAAITEIAQMKRGLAALDTIVTLAPLLGLLGTIIGMISSFNIMASTGLGQPHAVTGGVAEALIATACGISVAVATLIPYNYFLARIEKETDWIQTQATRMEVALKACLRMTE